MLQKILLLHMIAATLADDVIVELLNGPIRGREDVTFNGQQYFAFEGIPFAAPPIGNLRFQPPQPPADWTEILNTTQNNVICVQYLTSFAEESEDCLYLNVYTPQYNNGSSYPVMLYIYGGGFYMGMNLDQFCGPEFLIDQDVVVVTINYRVGPFGFLSTEDLVIPGNNGLKDQLKAIEWTYDNIMKFGGNRSHVTIFGLSAGSASVGFQLLYQYSQGLFRGAIMESGSPLGPWALQKRAREHAFKTAAFLNETFNHNNNSTELLEFLLSVSATELDFAGKMVKANLTLEDEEIRQGYFFGPVIEPLHVDAFITESPYWSLTNGQFLKIPTLIGFNSEEQIYYAEDLDWFKNSVMAVLDENPTWVVPNDMKIENSSLKEEMANSIKKLYTEKLFQNDLGAGIKFYSDVVFTKPIIKHAELQSKFSPVFFYEFSYDGVIGNISIDVEGAEKVSHGELSNYIFSKYYMGYDNRNMSVFPETDVTTHLRLVQIWTDFAKTYNPTPFPTDIMQNIQWPEVTSEGDGSFVYLEIGENLEIRRNPRNETYGPWVQLYNSLGYDDFDTY